MTRQHPTRREVEAPAMGLCIWLTPPHVHMYVVRGACVRTHTCMGREIGPRVRMGAEASDQSPGPASLLNLRWHAISRPKGRPFRSTRTTVGAFTATCHRGMGRAEG